MCAQFIIRATRKKLREMYRLEEAGGARADHSAHAPDRPSPDSDEEFDIRVMPYRPGPVVVQVDGRRKIETMQYSLLPSWSKERRVKFATHNARLETIDSKPTWKRPFVRRRCLIPLTDFIEPIYEGRWAGNMILFHRPGHQLLTAAGIWDEWISKEGEVVDSFAIITDEPIPFVRDTGHDRTPVFLREEAFDEWLSEGDQDPAELRRLLADYREIPDLGVGIDRPLKAGWEKRK